VDRNIWSEGLAGLVAQFSVAGEKMLADNMYEFHTSAGFIFRARPLPGTTLVVGINGDAYEDNATGFRFDLAGKVEISTRLLTALDNKIAADAFIGATARGSWHDSESEYAANLELGLRVVSVGGVRFDLFLEHDLIHGNFRGGHFRGLDRSLIVRDTSVIGNEDHGFFLKNTRAVIEESFFDGNQGNGLALRNSRVTVTGTQINENGKSGIDSYLTRLAVQGSVIVGNGASGARLDNSIANIIATLICSNALDGIHARRNTRVSAMGDIIDQNGEFEVRNNSPHTIVARSNDWGPATAEEMDSKPVFSNISRLFDVFDSPGRGLIDYNNWVSPGVGCSPSPTPSPAAATAKH
jgi:hypothetical protein